MAGRKVDMNELTIICGDNRVVLQRGQGARIGRSSTSNLVVDDPRVSREHLRVSWASDGWILENVGRAGSFTSGRAISQFLLDQTVDVHLAAPDGPVVRFEPPIASPVGAASPGALVGGRPPAAAGTVPPPAAAARPLTPSGPRAAAREDLNMPMTGGAILGALRILVPVWSWMKDPEMRKWYRLVVVIYAVAPLAFLLMNTGNFKTLGWVYSLYIAPLWALVFWYLIRPGRLTRLDVLIGAIFVGAEYVLVPIVVIPWENSLAPGNGNHNLIQWIYGVGLAEELTKAIPVFVVGYLLLKVFHRKLDSRKWMFLATISGLMFGVSEAAGYVSQALAGISRGAPIVMSVQEFAERVFVDGFQHAVWAGIAGLFIGLGLNYRRQRIPLWIFAILVPSVLHGLNDWSLSGYFGFTNSTIGTNPAPWLAIQVASVLIFLAYTVSAASIERQVRHTPLFRGESILMDPSRQQAPPPPNT